MTVLVIGAILISGLTLLALALFNTLHARLRKPACPIF